MIARIWHGFTSLKDADQYEKMLREDVLPGICKIAGYKEHNYYEKNIQPAKYSLLRSHFLMILIQ